tara:strand:+ start:24 stop:515 length:492 start_codon:yes stop_codon:yes gene_type:complete
MRIFLNTGFFIFLINGYLNPVFSFQKINNNIQNNQKNFNLNSHKVLQIANKNNSKNQDFILKEIPDFSVEKLKNSVKENKDPFGENSLSAESSTFEDLYIVLVGLFKIKEEMTAMFITKDGIKNYIIGDKIKDYYVIKNIDLISKEVLITDGKEQKVYKFPEK